MLYSQDYSVNVCFSHDFVLIISFPIAVAPIHILLINTEFSHLDPITRQKSPCRKNPARSQWPRNTWQVGVARAPIFSRLFSCDEAVFFQVSAPRRMVFGREKYRPRTRKSPKLLGRIVMYLTTLLVKAMRYLLPASHRIHVEKVSIRHEKASKFPSKKLRIVHLSDIHHDEPPFVPRILHSQLDEVVEISNSLEADLILITGTNPTIIIVSILRMPSCVNSAKLIPLVSDIAFSYVYLHFIVSR